MDSTKDRIFGLDVMRAMAIICVLLSHSSIFLDIYFPGCKNMLKLLGFMGVELFFVLSGFLIGTILLKSLDKFDSAYTLIHFWIRRWFRTLPNYYLFLGIHFALFSLFGFKSHMLWIYFIFLQNFLNWEGGIFPVSWSLTIEEWFYIIFPFLLMVGLKVRVVSKLKRAHWFLCLVFMLILLFLYIRTHLVINLNPAWGTGVRLSLIMRLDAPLYGVLAAYFAYSRPNLWKKYKTVCFVLGIATSLIWAKTFYFHSKLMDNSFFHKTIFFVIVSISFSLLLPLFSYWRAKNSWWSQAVTCISLWSYSLYLCHDPIRRIVYYAYLPLKNSGYIINITFLFVYILLSIYLARIVYLNYEKPIMDLRDKFNIRLKN